ncbi:MAG TPA: FG-GAP-like repeat-containing protein [Isosphaeraceae bacterium]|nr:FG-GAP-like repeat-containing protein [Isosphaeraceae bacterium]
MRVRLVQPHPEALEERTLLSVFVVTNTNDSGPGSLRQAILNTYNQPPGSTIDFNIAPGGVQTIMPLTALPQIVTPVTIDGTTQPGFAGTPLIDLLGVQAGSGSNGLLIAAGGTTVQGLAIDEFSGSAIRMEVKGGNVIQGNFLGLDTSGTTSPGNGVDGVLIINGSAGNVIGGATPGTRNVIAGNQAIGVRISGATSAGNVVEGNFIGTDVTGTKALPNAFDGVLIDGSPSNLIGGLTPQAANVISGNGSVGVAISGASSTGNLVDGNLIGTQADGVSALGNASNGVFITAGASGNVIGGMAAGSGNVIAFNNGAGVATFQATGNAILSNSIFSNTFLGIDINSDGLTLTNLPTMTSAFRVGTTSLLQGTITSAPNTFLVLQFFASPSPGVSGYGGSGGSTLLGTTAVLTNASGSGTFRFTLSQTLAPGQWVFATATDGNHATWEASQGVFYQDNTAGDFDGDGKADLALFRPGASLWQILGSQVGPRSLQFGIPGSDSPVPADYDNDGKTDVAVFQAAFGNWFISGSKHGPFGFQFGAPGDIPVPADYDGDGKTDPAVFRPSTGQWFIQGSRQGGFVVNFGAPGDIPVPGDYDGTGQTELAFYRPSTAQWFILGSTGPRVIQFGPPKLGIPVPGDYDGDGKTDIAVYEPSTAQWFINGSSSGPRAVTFGAPNADLAVPLDYDGDGKTDLAVYRPSTATWYILQSTAGPRVQQFGTPNADLPALLPLGYRILGNLLPFSTPSSTSSSSVTTSSVKAAAFGAGSMAATNDPLVVLPPPSVASLSTTTPSTTAKHQNLLVHDSALDMLAIS